MIAAIVLVLMTVAYRVILGISGSAQMDWWHNFSPMAAIALCGAVYFPRRVALLLPLGALFLSDLVLNSFYQVPWFSFEILPRYVALAMIAGFGWLLRDNPKPFFVLSSSLGASILFFLLTNTGSWLSNPQYAGTFSGWAQAMTTGTPGFPSTLFFFRNTLISDVFFTSLFLICLALQRQPEDAHHRAAKPTELAPW